MGYLKKRSLIPLEPVSYLNALYLSNPDLALKFQADNVMKFKLLSIIK